MKRPDIERIKRGLCSDCETCNRVRGAIDYALDLENKLKEIREIVNNIPFKNALAYKVFEEYFDKILKLARRE